jgi:hypothetical protein
MDNFIKPQLIVLFCLLLSKSALSETVVSTKDTGIRKENPPFKFQSQLEFSGGYSTRRYANWNFRTINGVSLGKGAFAGIGFGLLSFRDQATFLFTNYTYVPVFARVSIKPMKNDKVFLFSDLGTQFKGPNNLGNYQLKSDPTIFKPLFWRIGTGTELKSKHNTYYMALSYKYNKARYFYRSFRYGDYSISDWYRSHTVELTVGIRLK